MQIQVKRISNLGLTARQLLNMTPSYVRYKGSYVKPVKIKIETNNGTKHYSTTTRTTDEGKPRKHIQSIYLLSGDKLSENRTRVLMSCDCDFFYVTMKKLIAVGK